MNKNLCSRIAALAGAVLLGAVFLPTAWAESREITVNGSTDSCYSREIASKLARTDAVNTANKECRDIGTGWSYTGNVIWGREQCFRCGKSEEFKCKVFDATYRCTNTKKEAEEKAAKRRAEKEEAAKEAKEKAAQEKAINDKKEARQRAWKEQEAKDKAAQEKADNDTKAVKQRAEKAQEAKEAAEKSAQKKTEKGNSIDDAFSNMEKQTGKTPTAKAGNIDSEFQKMEAHRAEQERQRVAALKAKQEGETREREKVAKGKQLANLNQPWAEKDNGATVNWNEAKAYCASKGSGWRLPTVAELLENYRTGQPTPCRALTCKVASYTSLSDETLWANEEVPSATYKAQRVFMDTGFLDPWDKNKPAARALCVWRP